MTNRIISRPLYLHRTNNSAKANSSSAIEVSPRSYGTRSFTTVFKTAWHSSLSPAKLTHSTSFYPNSFKTHFNIFIHTYTALPSRLFRQASNQKFCMKFFPSSCVSPGRGQSKQTLTQGYRQRR
jgi:hypothetical protein